MAKWIIVADRSSARFFESQAGNYRRSFKFLIEVLHPAGRLKVGELDSSQNGSRHVLDSNGKLLDHESAVFAKSLMNTLMQLKSQNRFEELVLVSPPKFLGVLRKHLPISLKKCLKETFPLELTELSLEQTKAKLRKLIPNEIQRPASAVKNSYTRRRRLAQVA